MQYGFLVFDGIVNDLERGRVAESTALAFLDRPSILQAFKRPADCFPVVVAIGSGLVERPANQFANVLSAVPLPGVVFDDTFQQPQNFGGSLAGNARFGRRLRLCPFRDRQGVVMPGSNCITAI